MTHARRQFNTPVLFLVFNRPEHTRRVFEAIRVARPPKLYVAADGPREGVPADSIKVKDVREYILSHIDWHCEVKTLFRSNNSGCKYAVSSAIDWFFDNEERGIVIEDDCLPNQSFFSFCEELLEKYKDESRIWHISGTNFQNRKTRGEASYYFSALSSVWGWASWRRAWKYYDVEAGYAAKEDFLGRYWRGESLRYWETVLQKLRKREINTWDYQWNFALWANGGVAIVPNVNLVSNIGFGQDATHTRHPGAKANCMPSYELSQDNMVHPADLKIDGRADYYAMSTFILPPSLINRMSRRVLQLLTWAQKNMIACFGFRL